MHWLSLPKKIEIRWDGARIEGGDWCVILMSGRLSASELIGWVGLVEPGQHGRWRACKVEKDREDNVFGSGLHNADRDRMGRRVR